MKVKTHLTRNFVIIFSSILIAWLILPRGIRRAIQPTAHAAAKTFTVDTTNNGADANPGDGICATGIGNCSLRAAIQEANANNGKDTINFNIPGSGVQTIQPGPGSLLPDITEAVIIDGSTQPGFSSTPLIQLDGLNAGTGIDGLVITANNCSVLHLAINRFDRFGIRLVTSNGNTIQGNFIGTNAAGTVARSNGGTGLVITGDNNTIGGAGPNNRNVISGNGAGSSGGAGIQIFGSGNSVTNNYIGTDVTGTKAIANGGGGLLLSGSNNTIGLAGAGNLISGNSGQGIALDLGGGNVLKANLIGTKANGVSALPNNSGIALANMANGNAIGGQLPGEGNVIAFNRAEGIFIENNCVGDGILGNSIFENGISNGLGIDLSPLGVTANDAGDGDSGANDLQNFPVITAASISTGAINIQGTLNSVANKSYAVSFYANPACDPSGNGEGKSYIGSTNVSTNGSGNASFNVTFSGSVNGQVITATATNDLASTSEFSQCFTATAAGGVIQFQDQYTNPTEGFLAANVVLTRTGSSSGAVTVDYATYDDTASQRTDYTMASGTLMFASGETTKTLQVLINDDAYVEGDERLIVKLSNPTGGAVLGAQDTTLVIISDNDTSPSTTNPIDNARDFVYQLYHDFLNREPDSSGLTFWTNNITSCGSDAACREVKRIDTAAAFFLSIEFMETGAFAIRIQRSAFGRKSADPASRITYEQFIHDARQVGDGVVVLQSGWESKLEANKQAYVNQIVDSAAFLARYPTGMTADQFVDALFSSAGVTPTASERQAAINAFGGGGAGRALALRSVADSNSVRSAEFSPAFVLIQYFGCLRRNPTDAPDNNDNGYQFWLTKLNGFNGDYRAAEMVKAFIASSEYRARFGAP